MLFTNASAFTLRFVNFTFPLNIPTFRVSGSKSSINFPIYRFKRDATTPSNILFFSQEVSVTKKQNKILAISQLLTIYT